VKPVGSIAIVALVITLIGLTSASMGLYLPSVPSMVRALDTDFASVQLTMSVFFLGYGAFQLVIGPLSDRHGRRGVLVWSLVLYVAASAACAVAPDIGFLIAARLLQSAGACAALVIGRAVVRDTHTPAGTAQAFGYISTAMVVVPIAAPIVGGYIDAWTGWPGNFALMAIMGAAALAVLLIWLPETIARRDPHAAQFDRLMRNYVSLMAERRYRSFMLVSGFTFATIFAYSSSAPIVLIDLLGVSPLHYGYLIGAPIALFGVSAFISARLTARLGPILLIEWGALITAASGLAMAAFAFAGITVWGVIVAAVLVNFGAGFIIPNAQAAAIAPYPHMAGTASALTGAMQMLLAAVIAAVVGQFYDDSARPMGIGMALSGLAVLALHLHAKRRARP
jgi:DHA1 family bicyclomycin/chloramphenicol resistance-like MFS transporter